MHKQNIIWEIIKYSILLVVVISLGVWLNLSIARNVGAHWDDDVWVNNQRQELKDWDSVLELECFLAMDDGEPLVIRAGADGKVSFSGHCEDFAFQLRNRAMAWGKYLDVEIITQDEYYDHFKERLPSNVVHAINKAVIGNEFWFVDKTSGDIWHQYNLD